MLLQSFERKSQHVMQIPLRPTFKPKRMCNNYVKVPKPWRQSDRQNHSLTESTIVAINEKNSGTSISRPEQRSDHTAFLIKILHILSSYPYCRSLLVNF
jgi:hypothetical protein